MYTQAPSQQTFCWPSGMKVPQGSMTPDGKPVPEGAEPQPDGTLKLPSGSVIPAEGVVLPDGVKIIDVMKPTGEVPKPVTSMPDGSKPSTQQGSWSWTMYTQAPSQQTFCWPSGMKVPQGTMTPDGKPVPEGAEPQPDGTLKLPSGSVIPAEGVALPDGVKIIDVMKPTGEAPKPATSMPDGSKRSTQQGSWNWTMYTQVPGVVSGTLHSSDFLCHVHICRQLSHCVILAP